MKKKNTLLIIGACVICYIVVIFATGHVKKMFHIDSDYNLKSQFNAYYRYDGKYGKVYGSTYLCDACHLTFLEDGIAVLETPYKSDKNGRIDKIEIFRYEGKGSCGELHGVETFTGRGGYIRDMLTKRTFSLNRTGEKPKDIHLEVVKGSKGSILRLLRQGEEKAIDMTSHEDIMFGDGLAEYAYRLYTDAFGADEKHMFITMDNNGCNILFDGSDQITAEAIPISSHSQLMELMRSTMISGVNHGGLQSGHKAPKIPKKMSGANYSKVLANKITQEKRAENFNEARSNDVFFNGLRAGRKASWSLAVMALLLIVLYFIGTSSVFICTFTEVLLLWLVFSLGQWAFWLPDIFGYHPWGILCVIVDIAFALSYLGVLNNTARKIAKKYRLRPQKYVLVEAVIAAVAIIYGVAMALNTPGEDVPYVLLYMFVALTVICLPYNILRMRGCKVSFGAWFFIIFVYPIHYFMHAVLFGVIFAIKVIQGVGKTKVSVYSPIDDSHVTATGPDGSTTLWKSGDGIYRDDKGNVYHGHDGNLSRHDNGDNYSAY